MPSRPKVKELATNANFLATNANFHDQTLTYVHDAYRATHAVAFGSCSVSGSGCAEGYMCKQAICMPTVATVEASKHDSKFSTRLEHATRMIATDAPDFESA